MMIVPYYNVLLVGGDLDKMGSADSQIFEGYWKQLLRDHDRLEQHISILIKTTINETESLKKDLMATLLSLPLQRPLLPLADNLTTCPKRYSLYHALKQVRIDPPLKRNKPVVLSELDELIRYHKNQPGLMKQMLKSLLVKNIDHERKIINYHSMEEVQGKITQLCSSIKGNISFETLQDQNSVPSTVYLVFDKQLTLNSLETSIQEIKRRITVNCHVNTAITESYTLLWMRQQSQQYFYSKFCLFTEMYQSDRCIRAVREVSMDLKLAAVLRAVLRQGIKLLQEQEQLEKQFRQYLQEITKINSMNAGKYIAAFKETIKYGQIKRHQFRQQQSSSILNKYFKGIVQIATFQPAKKKYIQEQCIKVQCHIRRFVGKFKAQRLLLQYYNDLKVDLIEEYNQRYRKIVEEFNRQSRVNCVNTNRHKHGFVCYLHLLTMQTQTGYFEFAPQRLEKILAKVVRKGQPIAKIECDSFCLRIIDMEGNCHHFGENPNSICFNQQNRPQNNIEQSFEQKKVSSVRMANGGHSRGIQELSLPHCYQVETGTPHLLINYRIYHYINSLDPLKAQLTRQFLTNPVASHKGPSHNETMLVQDPLLP